MGTKRGHDHWGKGQTPSACPCEYGPGPTTSLVPPRCCHPMSGLDQPKKASNLMPLKGWAFWGSLRKGLGAPHGFQQLGWRDRTPPQPRCHRPVTPQEPYQCLGNDSNLCLGCQVEVELCHGHHHLWTHTQVSHGGNGGHPEEWPCPPVPLSALGDGLTLRTPISGCPSSTPVSPRLWAPHKPRQMDTTRGPGEGAGWE